MDFKRTNILKQLGVGYTPHNRVNQEARRKIKSMQMCPAFKQQQKDIVPSSVCVY